MLAELFLRSANVDDSRTFAALVVSNDNTNLFREDTLDEIRQRMETIEKTTVG